SALEDFAIELLLRCDVTHESSGEGISGTGWIFDLLKGQGWRAKGMRADSESTFAEENRRTVLPMLDYQSLRPHRHDLAGRAQQALLVCQHVYFVVIDEKNVHQLQGFCQFFRCTSDPIIHGVATCELHVLQLEAHSGLQSRVDVSEKEE